LNHNYTATEISRALGRKRQSVQRSLRNAAPPSSRRRVQGNEAHTWALNDLPADLFDILKEKAVINNSPVDQLLSSPQPVWQPPIPLSEISDRQLTQARLLKQAFHRALYQLRKPGVAKQEAIKVGLADYTAIFGRSISEGQWCRKLQLILDRDGGAQNWQRLELYLPRRIARKPIAKVFQARCNRIAFGHLLDLVAQFADPAQPTREEMALFWSAIFDTLEDRTNAQRPRNYVQQALLNFLEKQCPWLSENRSSLERLFRQKHKRWRESDGDPNALIDGRKHSGNQRAPQLTEGDLNQLLARALERNSVSRAWRECLAEGLLSEPVTEHYTQTANPSHVPHKVRKVLQPDFDNLQDWKRGPRQARLNGAYINRDPNGIASGDWYQADDATLPVYYYDEYPDGSVSKPIRGQFLAMIDCRSWMILGFALISERYYSAFHIRNLITRVGEEHGLSRQGFYFENGLWKTAKLLKGRNDELPWSETELGLRALGLRFRHAQLPRGKVIERVFGALQSRLEGDPGYVGRDEKNDTFDRMQRKLSLIRRGNAHPGEHLWSKDRWIERLTELCQEYNDEPQYGKYHQGCSPKEVYERCFTTPLIKLDADTRFLLATNKIPVTVGRNGISFQYGKQRFTYKNAHTGRFRGKRVIAYFNPECSEFLTFTDPSGNERYTVEREVSVPAMDAPQAVLNRALQQNAEHDLYRRVL